MDASFKFSQHSLNDYVACPRRFYLHYVAKLAWPVVEPNPIGLQPLDYQRYLWRGTELHRWIERYWLGIPTPPDSAPDEEMRLWWDHFLHLEFNNLPAQRIPELGLVAPVGDHLLYARFDLLACDASTQASRAVIVDWKTLRTSNHLSAHWFARRIQTRVYLYVLATAGAPYNGGQPFAPEQCSMRYWLANYPDQPWVDIPYSTADYERDRTWLLGLLERASSGQTEEDYARGSEQRQCMRCTYQTLCNRSGGIACSTGPDAFEDEYFDVDSAAEAASIDY